VASPWANASAKVWASVLAGDGVGVGEGVGVGAEPDSENEPLNLGEPKYTMSVPTRSQSGSRLALRIHVWRSPAIVGPAAESQRKSPDDATAYVLTSRRRQNAHERHLTRSASPMAETARIGKHHLSH
jgi:hypothetical protein